MAEQLTNYQCPNCNGPLHFEPKSQKLKCDNCGSQFTIEQIDALFEEKNEEAVSVTENQDTFQADSLQWNDSEKQSLRAYSCPSCGAQLITDETTAATSCPYCGNPTVIPAQFDGALRPDYVIPFKLVKEEAVSKLQDFYHGKTLLPKVFTKDNHIEEIKGVYVPFWLYNADVEAHVRARGTRVTTHQTHDEIITTTYHYRLERDGAMQFNKVPADASSKMPDDLMDAIEPFDYKDLVPFTLSYLPGYLADKYDVASEDNAKRAHVRMRNTTLDEIYGTMASFQCVMPEKERVGLHPHDVHYALLPVWLLTTKYQGKTYLFAMNGQTGKMVGDDLPVDWGKFFLIFIGLTIVFMVVFYFLLTYVL